MDPHVYINHRAVNRPLEFKGLQNQYILYAGAVILVALFLFIIVYSIGLSPWICIGLAALAGGAGIAWVYRLNRRYGIHGWRKKRAARRIPPAIVYTTRTIFIELAND